MTLDSRARQKVGVRVAAVLVFDLKPKSPISETKLFIEEYIFVLQENWNDRLN